MFAIKSRAAKVFRATLAVFVLLNALLPAGVQARSVTSKDSKMRSKMVLHINPILPALFPIIQSRKKCL